MRYRQLDPDGDYVAGPAVFFLVNTPEAVAQAVETRIRLFAKEWFLDLREGLNLELILGYHTQGTRDIEVKQRIAGTKGFKTLLSYGSNVDPVTRKFSVSAVIDTIYGQAQVSVTEAL